jgi:L-lactate dehydrogenase (cytochrome)
MAGTRRHTFGNLVGHVKGVSDMSSLAAWTNEQFDPRLSWADVSLGQEALGRQADPQGHHGRRRRAPGRGPAPTPSSSATTAGGSSTARPSSISALPAIVEAVGQQTEVWMDGGIRSGQDVLKAWALGAARHAMIGRARRDDGLLYGLGAMARSGRRDAKHRAIRADAP